MDYFVQVLIVLLLAEYWSIRFFVLNVRTTTTETIILERLTHNKTCRYIDILTE